MTFFFIRNNIIMTLEFRKNYENAIDFFAGFEMNAKQKVSNLPRIGDDMDKSTGESYLGSSFGNGNFGIFW